MTGPACPPAIEVCIASVQADCECKQFATRWPIYATWADASGRPVVCGRLVGFQPLGSGEAGAWIETGRGILPTDRVGIRHHVPLRVAGFDVGRVRMMIDPPDTVTATIDGIEPPDPMHGMRQAQRLAHLGYLGPYDAKRKVCGTCRHSDVSNAGSTNPNVTMRCNLGRFPVRRGGACNEHRSKA